MKRIWKLFKERLLKIAKVDSTPVKIATGIGLGAFIAVFPITGFQFLTGLLLAFLFRVNRIAVVATTQLICNPLTLPFLVFLNFKIGEKILRYNSSMTLQTMRVLLRDVNFRNIFSVLGSIVKPLFLGSIVIAPFISIVAFVTGYFFVQKFKAHEKR